jgi:hypothetical protein
MSCVLPATDCSEKSTTLGNSTCVSSSYVDFCTMLSNLGISNELKLLLFTVSIINTGKNSANIVICYTCIFMLYVIHVFLCYISYMYFYVICYTCIFMLYVIHVFLCYMLHMYFYVICYTCIFMLYLIHISLSIYLT